jgi:hypothetical protein
VVATVQNKMKCLIKINNKYKKVQAKDTKGNTVAFCNHFCKYFYTNCIPECGAGSEHFPERDTRFQKKPIKYGHLTTS